MAQPKLFYLRSLRERRGLTQAQLERLSHVKQNTISRLEADRHSRPQWLTVVQLAEALHVNPEQLRFGPDPSRGFRRKEQVA